jgi:PadR family transcriptional regulator, regulatory protein PadR
MAQWEHVKKGPAIFWGIVSTGYQRHAPYRETECDSIDVPVTTAVHFRAGGARNQDSVYEGITPQGAFLFPLGLLWVYAFSHRTSRGEKVVHSKPDNNEMLKGTLDMMILRTLLLGNAHGHTIAKVIERSSEDVLEVEQGSLYPALHRLEARGWVSSYWGTSENNRKAKFYRLTAAGRKQLKTETSRWRQMARAIGLVMGESPLKDEGK